jgi:hypothetical protein
MTQLLWYQFSVWVTFASLWQNIWQKQFKGRKIYFGSWFQRVQFMVAWPCALEQNIMVLGACGRWKPFLMADRKWWDRKVSGTRYHKDLLLVTSSM